MEPSDETLDLASGLARSELTIRLARQLVHVLSEHLIRLADDHRKLEVASRNLEHESPMPHLPCSGFGYSSESKDIEVWLQYRRLLREKPNFGESPTVYAEALRLTESALAAGAAGVLNFGCCYPHVDSTLAKRHPNKTFVGVERSELVQALNRSEFSGISNLKFVSGDIFRDLDSYPLEDFVLLHTRTLTLLGPRFCDALYRFAVRRGVKWVVGVEPYGISRLSGACPGLTYEHRESVPFRGPMYLHSYPNLLDRNGFHLREAVMQQTSHAHLDYRLFCFKAAMNQAERIEV